MGLGTVFCGKNAKILCVLIQTEGYIEGEDLADQVAVLKTTMVGNEEYKDCAIGGVQFLKKMTDLGY